MQRRILFAAVVALGLSLLQPGTANAASWCDRDPRDPVAQMCASTSAHMYGSFTSFLYPVVGHSTSSAGNAYNATRVFTDDAYSTSYEFGLDVSWGSPTGMTHYQPYWVDYTGGYSYHQIGNGDDAPDDRPHTYMSFPHCDNCRSTDLFYDFNFAGTTKDGVSPNAHQMVTGWELSASSYGDVTIGRTANRIQWLNGNKVFERFPASAITTRAPAGNCAPGSQPAYCFRFDTNVAKDANGFVTAWEVTKPSVRPAAVTATRTVNQNALQQCMAEDASKCLDTVPGLRDCVQKRLVCNENAAITTRKAALTASEAREKAVEFLVSRKAISAAQAVSVRETGDAITVAFDQPVRELTGDHRTHARAELTFDRAGGLSVRMS
ncbi:hypothetical protein ABZ345_22355 [Lentzea sp. NPDC005914]|uniref:hypothetical protein n=1 Tax=Lentzea sp. NPDC005914 TaxID=3154572 RepID=UPI0033F374D1